MFSTKVTVFWQITSCLVVLKTQGYRWSLQGIHGGICVHCYEYIYWMNKKMPAKRIIYYFVYF